MAVDATTGITDLVSALHAHVARAPVQLAGPVVGGTINGITKLVYDSVRGVTRAVGSGLDAGLAQLERALAISGLDQKFAQGPPNRGREALVAALNGILGDYLAQTGNPLAIAMRVRNDGVPLALAPAALAATFPTAGARVAILLHGLCMNDLQWRGDEADQPVHDHGAALARDLGLTPLYVHYNSGLHISTNGRALAELLESLVSAWPVQLESVTLVGHSMGGLVARSAVHQADVAALAWRRRLRSIVFLGSPHHGAPLERGGQWLDALLRTTGYTAPFSRLGRVRSAGITDLRHGSVRDEDWRGKSRFAHGEDTRVPLPLPADVACLAIAATAGDASATNGQLRRGAPMPDLFDLPGDGLVPVASALGQHVDPRFTLDFAPADCWLAGRTGHLELLSSPAVYAAMRTWLSDPERVRQLP